MKPTTTRQPSTVQISRLYDALLRHRLSRGCDFVAGPRLIAARIRQRIAA